MVHIKLLQQALNHGLKLKKVHRVNEFEQSDWMKKYIILNIELRKKKQVMILRKISSKLCAMQFLAKQCRMLDLKKILNWLLQMFQGIN